MSPLERAIDRLYLLSEVLVHLDGEGIHTIDIGDGEVRHIIQMAEDIDDLIFELKPQEFKPEGYNRNE